jgi:hypothetical protein
MKKLLALALVAAFAAHSYADEKPAEKTELPQSTIWPAVIAVCEWPAYPDVVGLRITLPFSTRQETVTGVDIGLWGRCKDFEGFQLNLLRNDVKDTLGGLQVGCYNTVNRADLFAVQVGLINEAYSFRGLQCGLINIAGDGDGFQIGLINRAETFHGFQVGAINVIRDAEVPVMPLMNIGF